MTSVVIASYPAAAQFSQHGRGAPDKLGKFVLGTFELDLAAGELRKSGLKVRLQEQPFQLLAALVIRPGEVVTRARVGVRQNGTCEPLQSGIPRESVAC